MSTQHEKPIQPKLFSDLDQQQPLVTQSRPKKQRNLYANLIQDFLKDQKSPVTRPSYEADLRDFFSGRPSPSELQALLNLDEEELKQRLIDYEAYLRTRRTRPLKTLTIKRHLTTMRSFLRYAHGKRLSKTNGRGLIGKGRRRQGTREAESTATAKPQRLNDEMLCKLIRAPDTTKVRGARDKAILHLFCIYGLLRAQLCGLKVIDFEADDKVLWLRTEEQDGPHKKASVQLQLTEDTTNCIRWYLKKAGHANDLHSPLFRNVDRRDNVGGKGITYDGIYYLIHEYGEKIGPKSLNSRELRDAAISAALRAADGDVQLAHERFEHISFETFSRHSKNERTSKPKK